MMSGNDMVVQKDVFGGRNADCSGVGAYSGVLKPLMMHVQHTVFIGTHVFDDLPTSISVCIFLFKPALHII